MSMSIDLESSSSSFLDCLEFDEADVSFGLDNDHGITLDNMMMSDDEHHHHPVHSSNNNNNDISSIPLGGPTILDDIDEELFSANLSSEAVPSAPRGGEDDTLHEHDDDEDKLVLSRQEESLSMYYNSHEHDDYHRSSSSYEEQHHEGRHGDAPATKRSSLVTPEPPTTPLEDQVSPYNNNKNSDAVAPHLPDLNELQRQYQHTMNKLFKSMRQSDLTRSIVKRQKVLSFKTSMACKIQQHHHHHYQQQQQQQQQQQRIMAAQNFFQSERCRELEASRRQLMRSLNV